MSTQTLATVPVATVPKRPAWTKRLTTARHLVVSGKTGSISLAIFLTFVFIIIVSPWLPLPDAQAPNLTDRLMGPGHVSADGTMHWLGTDQLGRDVLSRMLLGGRVSLLVAGLTVVVSGSIGTAIGLLAGYRGGWIDSVVMRMVDFQMALPSLLLAVFLLYIIGSSVTNLVILLSIMSWYSYTRIVRSEVLRLKTSVYVDAARSIGATDGRRMFRHILPQVMPVLLVIAVFDFGVVMLAESSISFLGMGIQPPDTSWGRMISEGQQFITTGAWWVFAAPGAAIFMIVLTLRLSADWLGRVLGVNAKVN